MRTIRNDTSKQKCQQQVLANPVFHALLEPHTQHQMASTVPLCPWMSQICVALACSCIRSGLCYSTQQLPSKRPSFNTHAGTAFATHSKSNNPWLSSTDGRSLHSLRITAMKEQAVTAIRQSPMRAHGKVLTTFTWSDQCTKQLTSTASVATTPPMLNNYNWKRLAPISCSLNLSTVQMQTNKALPKSNQ